LSSNVVNNCPVNPFKIDIQSRRSATVWLYPSARPPRKPRPWRDIAILACPPPLGPPTLPAAGLRPSSVRARRLRTALACPTTHVSQSPGQIHNPIIIYRLLYWAQRP